MRTVLLITTAAVVLTPLVAHAAPPPPKDRVVTTDYTGTGGFTVPGRASLELGCAFLPRLPRAQEPLRCNDVQSMKGEKSLTVTAADASGLPVGLAVQVGKGRTQIFCGEAKVGLPKAAVPIRVATYSSTDCPGATTGTLTSRFSRR